jgi:cytochrome P450
MIALASEAFFSDPYPTYRRMRSDHPVYHDETTGLWFVSRHADIAEALSKPELFSSRAGNALTDSPLRVGKTLGSMDPPRHDELRRVIMRGVTPKRIDLVLPWIRTRLEEILQTFAARRQCDLVADITRPLLFGALARMLGLEAPTRAAELSEGLFLGDGGPAGPALPDPERARVISFLRDQVGIRRLAPGDDLISVLIAAQNDGAALSEDEIVANLMTVLLAGNASIGHFLPNVIHALWHHPEQRARVAADPEFVDAALEEAVRWDTSTQCFARITTAPISLAGTRIPEGARIALIYASANRDTDAIDNAESFDITRGKVRHFGFGSGPHICLGASATRAMLRTILGRLLPALGDYDLDIGNAIRVRHLMVRGFRSLPMSW